MGGWYKETGTEGGKISYQKAYVRGKDETKVWNEDISDEHLRPSSVPDKVGTPPPHTWEDKKSQSL